MADPIITLTTDFGDDSPYVAAMKGVILGINPAARLVDLSHRIPPQDVRHTAFFLAAAVPYFPAEVIHVVVVDPGVGTERPVLYVEGNGYRLLAPDNGCWTRLATDSAAVHRVTEPRYWRQPVSSTFHGRDIFAPVAAHLSLGVPAAAVGTPVQTWVTLERQPLDVRPDQITGAVEFVDHFGNLITNIPGAVLPKQGLREALVSVADYQFCNWVRTYGEAEPGALVALLSSTGHLEIAVNQGSAARVLEARVGTEVRVTVPPGG